MLMAISKLSVQVRRIRRMAIVADVRGHGRGGAIGTHGRCTAWESGVSSDVCKVCVRPRRVKQQIENTKYQLTLQVFPEKNNLYQPG
jgi:hypothetical protein